jgi:hypothetical protein
LATCGPQKLGARCGCSLSKADRELAAVCVVDGRI